MNRPGTFLLMSRGLSRGSERPVDLSGDVALEAAEDVLRWRSGARDERPEPVRWLWESRRSPGTQVGRSGACA